MSPDGQSLHCKQYRVFQSSAASFAELDYDVFSTVSLRNDVCVLVLYISVLNMCFISSPSMFPSPVCPAWFLSRDYFLLHLCRT